VDSICAACVVVTESSPAEQRRSGRRFAGRGVRSTDSGRRGSAEDSEAESLDFRGCRRSAEDGVCDVEPAEGSQSQIYKTADAGRAGTSNTRADGKNFSWMPDLR